jgi:hypothetical protein
MAEPRPPAYWNCSFGKLRHRKNKRSLDSSQIGDKIIFIENEVPNFLVVETNGKKRVVIDKSNLKVK